MWLNPCWPRWVSRRSKNNIWLRRKKPKWWAISLRFKPSPIMETWKAIFINPTLTVKKKNLICMNCFQWKRNPTKLTYEIFPHGILCFHTKTFPNRASSKMFSILLSSPIPLTNIISDKSNNSNFLKSRWLYFC